MQTEELFYKKLEILLITKHHLNGEFITQLSKWTNQPEANRQSNMPF
jgi:hypothetical protein